MKQSIDKNELANKLIEYRKLKKLSRGKLSELLGISIISLYRWEKGMVSIMPACYKILQGKKIV